MLTSRDPRRRRVLVEEALRAGVETPAPRRCRQAPRYTPEALAVVQRPLGTLIARRRWTLWVLGLSTLSLAWGIEVLFLWLLHGRLRFTRSELPIFDAQRPASLCGLYQSACYLAAALYSALVLGVRAHRLDDFRGRYRVWFWAALAFLLVHLDLACQCHQSLASVWEAATQPLGSAALASAWPLAYTAVLGSLLVRLGLEVQDDPASASLLALCGASWLGLLLLYWWPPAAHLGMFGTGLRPLLRMLAAWSAALATMIHARHIYRDAQGLPPPERGRWRLRWPFPRRPKRDAAGSAEGADERPVAIPISRPAARSGGPLPPETPRETRPRAAAADPSAGPTGRSSAQRQADVPPAPEPGQEEDEEIDAEDPDGQRWSRSERRRRKKERRRQRRESA